MTRRHARLFLLLTSVVLTQCAEEIENNQYLYRAQQVESSMDIDGILDEAGWQDSPIISLLNNGNGEVVSDSTMGTWVRACFDDQHLYIAYECNDADIWSEFSNRDDHLWERDAVEIFIDSDGELNTYYEIQVSPKNVVFDAHLEIPSKTNDTEIIAFNVEGIQSVVSIDGTLNMHEDIDKKWTVELAIPIADLDKEPARVDSKSWRINFFRMNHDKKGERPAVAWSPTGGNFHIPEKFGVMTFTTTNRPADSVE